MRDDIYEDTADGYRRISIKKLIGGGYGNGWFTNCTARYRIFLGGRSTKKSTNILGYEPILKLISDPRRNIIMLRQNEIDNRGSTFANLVRCIDDLGLNDYFITRMQPLEIEYKSTKQKIVFRGLNNPTSLKSIKFIGGCGLATDIYVEECSEVDDYEGTVLTIDGSLRLPEELENELHASITFVLNPDSPEHWTITEFFKGRLEPTPEEMEENKYMDFYDPEYILPFGKGLYMHISSYKINEWRNKKIWDVSAAEMKRKSPELYKTNFLGLPGRTTGLAYPEFSMANVITLEEAMQLPVSAFAIGIDTGLSSANKEGHNIAVKKGENPDIKVKSATVMESGIISNNEKIVILDEYFHSNNATQNSTNTDDREALNLPQITTRMIQTIADWVNKYGNRNRSMLMKGQINCFVDSADIGMLGALQMKAKEFGMYNLCFTPSTKVPLNTRVSFERMMLAYSDYLICDNCKNLIREFKQAVKGPKGEPRLDNDHALDAASYSMSPYRTQIIRWKNQFKELDV